MSKPGRGAPYPGSSEQAMPRGVERTTWLGGGDTVVIGRSFGWLKTRWARQSLAHARAPVRCMYRANDKHRAGRPAEPPLCPFSRTPGVRDVVPEGPEALIRSRYNPEQLPPKPATFVAGMRSYVIRCPRRPTRSAASRKIAIHRARCAGRRKDRSANTCSTSTPIKVWPWLPQS